MATITSTGLGSGLNIESIISGLMAVEQRPLDVLNQRQSEIETKISAYGKLKSALSTFQSSLSSLKSISAFQVFSATSSDDTVFTATASSDAVAASYTIDFSNSNSAHKLAQAHKMTSTNFTDSTSSTGAAGTMQIDVGSSSFTIDVDGSNDTLEGIRDAINNASGNDSLVTASIIKVSDTESRLVLTSNNTGTDNAITLTDNSGNVASTLGMTTTDAAQNAVFSIDGFQIERSSNVITDAIQGVTITLKQKSDTTQTLTVDHDTESVKTSVQSFVDAYNTLNSVINDLRQGDLQGDNSILSIESQMRNVFNTTPSGLTTSLQFLSEIGITTDSHGDLSLDSSKLESQLGTDYQGVAELLANDDQGYVYRMDSVASTLLDTSGLITTHTDSLNSQVSDIEDQKLTVQYRLDQIEQRLRSQFSALDSLMSNLNATGNYLTQQLSNLPG